MNKKDFFKIRKLYELKKVYRANSVESRKESSAEHTWSSLMLADFFLNIMKNRNIDRLRVYELLMYHDVVEIEAGDIPIHHEDKRKHKKKNELKALMKLKNEIPEAQAVKLVELFNEFEEKKTIEARFANAIDKIDAQIHELDYKKDWRGWTEEMLRRFYSAKSFEEFPELSEAFEEIVKFVKKKEYIKN